MNELNYHRLVESRWSAWLKPMVCVPFIVALDFTDVMIS